MDAVPALGEHTDGAPRRARPRRRPTSSACAPRARSRMRDADRCTTRRLHPGPRPGPLRRDPAARSDSRRRCCARAEDLLIDWLGSALAGKGARPVETIARFAERMGPDDGPSEVLIHRRGTSPLLAAMANAAASHVAEQDDVHNGSVFHPGRRWSSRRRWRWRRRSARSGARAAGRRRRRLRGRHPRRRVPRPLALQGLPHHRHRRHAGRRGGGRAPARAERRADAHAFGSAGTQSAGLWEFLRDAADSKQLHTAHAAGAGLTRGLSRAPTASPARSASSTARRAWPPACRATPTRRG